MKYIQKTNQSVKITICLNLCVILFTTFTESTFKFEDCSDNATSIFEIMNFTLSPDPVSMEQNISISTDVLLLEDIESSFVVETKHYRMQKIFGFDVDIPIPCIAGKYGSCCPMLIGNYRGDDVEIKMRRIPTIGQFIVRGKYRTELRLRDVENNNTELACFKIFTELE